MQTMIAPRMSVVVLAVAASFASMGCQPAVPPPAGNQKAHPVPQKEAVPRVARPKLDDNSVRVRLIP